MTICAPNPFGCCGGSRLLKGGYSYWPLWWYGQRDELPDMSGHGVTLYPSGAYFDGQGYYFDGNDYLIDDDGRRVFREGTLGSWHSIYLTEGVVPAKGSIWGTGTKIKLNTAGTAPEITGKIVLRSAYCPNLTHLYCENNDISVLDVNQVTSLKYISCYANNISSLNVSALTELTYLHCCCNDMSTLDVSGATKLEQLYCYWGKLSTLDVSALTELTSLRCFGNWYISTLDVSALTKLEDLQCYYNQISLLDVSAITGLLTLKCYYNSMDQDMVDTVLCDMDSHGTSNGTLNISSNAAPSATGVACKDNLVARGWSVTTD